jgi:hypothetical protein
MSNTILGWIICLILDSAGVGLIVCLALTLCPNPKIRQIAVGAGVNSFAVLLLLRAALFGFVSAETYWKFFPTIQLVKWLG